MKRKGRARLLGLVLVIAAFAAAVWLLKNQLQSNDLSLAKIVASLRQIPVANVCFAVVVTVINYAVILTCYDYLAFRYAGVVISLKRVAFAAVTGYAFSYNFGATFAGLPLRYRFYSSWGLPLAKIVQLLVILALTFWFGVFFIAGSLFVFAPLRIPDAKRATIENMLLNEHLHKNVVDACVYLISDSRPFGILLLALTCVYIGASLLHRDSLSFFGWKMPVPPFRLTIYQVGIAAADMLVAASVLYALFPPVIGGYLTVLKIYLVAFSLIVLSHVPGGWGVLEAVMITLLRALDLVPDPGDNMARVVAAIIAFRVIYYMFPLVVAAAMVGFHEYALRRHWISPLTAARDTPFEIPGTAEGTNGRAGGISSDSSAAKGRNGAEPG
jgi:uncharacterized membrane protein YbhN (UPF0104 family)